MVIRQGACRFLFQSDIIHQSALELIHSEDREQFKFQLNWQQQLTGDTSEMTLEQALLPSKHPPFDDSLLLDYIRAAKIND